MIVYLFFRALSVLSWIGGAALFLRGAWGAGAMVYTVALGLWLAVDCEPADLDDEE